MATVPIEYLVIAFPDGNISEEIAPELADLVDKKVIRILDIVFVTKDTSGGVNVLEFDELENLAGFAGIDGEVGGLIGPDGLDFVASELDPGCAAAVLLMEDLWAAPWPARWTAPAACCWREPVSPRTCSPPRSPNWPLHPDPAPLVRTRNVTGITSVKGTRIMRRRRIAREAVKTAIIAKAAHRLGRRAAKHLIKH